MPLYPRRPQRSTQETVTARMKIQNWRSQQRSSSRMGKKQHDSFMQCKGKEDVTKTITQVCALSPALTTESSQQRHDFLKCQHRSAIIDVGVSSCCEFFSKTKMELRKANWSSASLQKVKTMTVSLNRHTPRLPERVYIQCRNEDSDWYVLSKEFWDPYKSALWLDGKGTGSLF